MADLEPGSPVRLVARADQPLIGVIRTRQGQDEVEYFTDEAAAAAATSDEDIEEALSLAGAWGDLDSDDLLDQLDRIRHESIPTPPIEFPDLDL